jgi:hypothetical protein
MFIQANIGRNVENAVVGAGPMSDAAWSTFQKDVKDEIFLAVHTADINLAFQIEFEDFQVHTGVGEWQGVKEESAHISVYLETINETLFALETITSALGERLQYLAFQYRQSAIAYVVTESHLAMRVTSVVR